MASYRHLARTCVMQTIFLLEFHKDLESNEKPDPQKNLDFILDEFAPKMTERDFANKTLAGVLTNTDEILKIIQKFAPEWPIDKIARIDRAILEIGAYEIIFSGDVPPVVAINEAVEVAKQYGDLNSPKFVNGVLSSIMKAYAKV